MRRKNKKFTSASDAITKMTKRIGLAKKMRQYELWNKWDKIAGPNIAAHARPLRWYQDTLVVAVDHASWMQELTFLKQEILKKIISAVPHIAIKEIRLEIGKIPPREAPPPKALDFIPELNRDEKEFVEQTVNEIKDDKTKFVFASLMTKDFLRRKNKK